ncbi:MAG TPA: hypothetical protein VHM19_05130, partial [Polyangiales bacterium]|nr:hypothetical protein [Polyangiales bacterium]
MRKKGARHSYAGSLAAGTALLSAVLASWVQAQPAGSVESRQWTTADDHRHMQSQLGIRELRPGRNADATKPNAANYDEALANPYPVLPDPLVSKSGMKITTQDEWWTVRRPEIVEDFER